MHKRNGYYYIFAPAGGVKTGWQTVLRSKNVLGPYEYKVVMRQGDTKINGPHQGAWIDTVTGEDWFVHFQDVYGAGRITHLQPMHWEKDWPVIGVAKDGNDYGEPVLEYKKPNVGNVQTEVCEPDTSDDFTGKELGLQWQWNANYKKEWYEISGENLKLWAINHSKDEVYGNMANLLLQKWPAPEFSCVTKMNLSNLCIGDEAGVISMGVRYGVLVFAKEESQVRIKYVIGKQNYVKILEETTDEDILSQRVLPMVEEIYVKYEVKRVGIQDLGPSETGYPLERVTISYSLDGKEYLEAGSMYAVPGRWVGVKNGVFCSRKEQGKGGYATIESVMYNYK
jgi:beta-xylosidase